MDKSFWKQFGVLIGWILIIASAFIAYNGGVGIDIALGFLGFLILAICS